MTTHHSFCELFVHHEIRTDRPPLKIEREITAALATAIDADQHPNLAAESSNLIKKNGRLGINLGFRFYERGEYTQHVLNKIAKHQLRELADV